MKFQIISIERTEAIHYAQLCRLASKSDTNTLSPGGKADFDNMRIAFESVAAGGSIVLEKSTGPTARR